MPSFRCSPELKELITKVLVRNPKLRASDVIGAVLVGIDHNRPVIQREIDEVYYAGPVPCVFPIRRELPKMEHRELRRIIALRCFEELDKPATPPRMPEIKYQDQVFTEVEFE